MIKRGYVFAEPCLDASNWIGIKELDLCSKDLVDHLIVHIRIAEHKDVKDCKTSDETGGNKQEDDDRPCDWVLGFLLLLLGLLGPY